MLTQKINRFLKEEGEDKVDEGGKSKSIRKRSVVSSRDDRLSKELVLDGRGLGKRKVKRD